MRLNRLDTLAQVESHPREASSTAISDTTSVRAYDYEQLIHDRAALSSRILSYGTLLGLIYLLTWRYPILDYPSLPVILVGTFGVMPFILRHVFRERMILSFPLFVIYVVLGFMIMLSDSAHQAGNNPSVFSLALLTLSGAFGGAYLFRREIVRSIARAGSNRSEPRIKVDALVRIRFCSDGSSPRTIETESDNEQMTPINNCVVIRDISPSGAGIYGFPDDISLISRALSGRDEAIIEIIYREESYFLTVDCRWWKGGRQKGECGLRFNHSSASSMLFNALMRDATNLNGKPIEALLSDRSAPPVFTTLTWLYSFVGILILTF